MPGSLTTPGRPALAMTRSDVLPSTICTVSAPKIGLFRGSMAGLCAPLSTLRRDPRGPLRMTWGRCGSLLLHRKGLSPSTPCRSPGASQMLSALHPKADMRPVILRLKIKYAPRLFPSQCNYLVAGGANKEPIALHEEHARLPLRHSANAVPRSRSLPALKV
jgi:hypothetical protein